MTGLTESQSASKPAQPAGVRQDRPVSIISYIQSSRVPFDMSMVSRRYCALSPGTITDSYLVKLSLSGYHTKDQYKNISCDALTGFYLFLFILEVRITS